MVTPDYYDVPHYQDITGIHNFSMWTALQRSPDGVPPGFTTRTPHRDIDYYNFLSFSHRRYMRSVAIRFGVYGFCYSHYWHRGQALYQTAMEKILEDDEPDIPFFMAWANGALTLHHSIGKEAVTPHQYGNAEDHVVHFEYLIKLFEHRNYMTYKGMPILAITQLPPRSVETVSAVVEVWQQMAVRRGLKGIFVLLQDEQLNSIATTSGLFSGSLELEPSLSQQVELGMGMSSNIRWFSKTQTWREIERRQALPQASPGPGFFSAGTYWNYNDAPRFRASGSGFSSLIRVHAPNTLDGFGQHLTTLNSIMTKRKFDVSLLLLNSWNMWDEQSMIEPNDVDGYDALKEIKNIFVPRTGKAVLHIGACPEVNRYVSDLRSLFSEYDHIVKDTLDFNPASLILVHAHFHAGSFVDPPQLLSILRHYKSLSVPICITIHDYFWIFPDNEIAFAGALRGAKPIGQFLKRTIEAFEIADVVISPSFLTRSTYLSSPGLQSMQDNFRKFPVVTPPDYLLTDDGYMVPSFAKTIGVAYVGKLFRPVEGSDIFFHIAKLYPGVGNKKFKLRLNYHVLCQNKYYNATSIQELHEMSTLQLHGSAFHDSKIVPHGIHLLLYLSEYPDPYSYDLTIGINSGLPIVYLNSGTLKERFKNLRSPRFFPVDGIENIRKVYTQAIKFVVHNGAAGTGLLTRSKSLQPPKWYLYFYPQVRSDSER